MWASGHGLAGAGGLETRESAPGLARQSVAIVCRHKTFGPDCVSVTVGAALSGAASVDQHRVGASVRFQDHIASSVRGNLS
jgi:hypothetical protein